MIIWSFSTIAPEDAFWYNYDTLIPTLAMSSRTKIIIVFVVVLIVGSGAVALWQGQNQIPQSFTDARLKGAAIAENIVNMSSSSTAELAQVNTLDAKGNYTDALTMTTDLVTQSQALRDQAVQLSNQIGAMTQALSLVNSLDARQAALEGIADQLALINQLINYSGDLDKLLLTLQNHFTNKAWQPNDVVSEINAINADVTAINNFNSQATQAMQKFDTIANK